MERRDKQLPELVGWDSLGKRDKAMNLRLYEIILVRNGE
jgi:hypothetical protein